MRVTHPASCESKGQISERQSHTEGSLWGSLSSVGKQMEHKIREESNEHAQSTRKKQIGQRGADLCFHGNRLLPRVKVSLLHFLLKPLGEKRVICGVLQQNDKMDC